MSDKPAPSTPQPQASSGEPNFSAKGVAAPAATKPKLAVVADSSDMDLGTPSASADLMADLELESPRKYKDMDLGNSLDLTPGTLASASDTAFDEAIGHIEDIIMDEEFQTLQRSFLEKHYHEFEDTEENKLIYTDIHKEYSDTIETHIVEELQKRQKDFDLEQFLTRLVEGQDTLEGEVFEMLFSFSDFPSFKEIMLDYKREKDGDIVDLSHGLTVTSLSEPPTPTNATTTPPQFPPSVGK